MLLKLSTQKAMSELFNVGQPAIAKLCKIFSKMENWRKIELFPKWNIL